MSFKFNNEIFENKDFNKIIKEKLNKAYQTKRNNTNSSSTNGTNSGSNILKNGITVTNVDFPTPPSLEILDLALVPKSVLKGIAKVLLSNATIEISTTIEANLLLLYTNNSTPDFISPDIVCNDSFTVPINMTFSNIHLEAISNISMDRSGNSGSQGTGLGVSFNDVNLDFDFYCSIKLLQSSIERRLKQAMDSVFKDVLPSVIFNSTMKLFSKKNGITGKKNKRSIINGSNNSDNISAAVTLINSFELEDLSPVTLLKLSTMVSSRNSLSLLPSKKAQVGCLERPNLYKYIMLNKNNSQHLSTCFGKNSTTADSSRTDNLLPNNIDLSVENIIKIADLQTSIYKRAGKRHNNKVRRRKIVLKHDTNNTTNATSPHPVLPSKELLGNKLSVTPTPILKTPIKIKDFKNMVGITGGNTPASPSVNIGSSNNNIREVSLEIDEYYDDNEHTISSNNNDGYGTNNNLLFTLDEDNAFDTCYFDANYIGDGKHTCKANNNLYHTKNNILSNPFTRQHYSFVGIPTITTATTTTTTTNNNNNNNDYIPDEKSGKIDNETGILRTEKIFVGNTNVNQQHHPPPPYTK
ncbi:uncharacterized protein SCODWIG_02367 [Saccharomycodes ludwigii]|uniref:SMP-LTD domain-containing protein n=1 Tax=Saccharomycodes ludwigii TaxID=36035 RepID=A0A376B7C3_9ASCO|nr:uncharacterized protein SCODWIG_02367 [Saccharomycodes ludwigii]